MCAFHLCMVKFNRMHPCVFRSCSLRLAPGHRWYFGLNGCAVLGQHPRWVFNCYKIVILIVIVLASESRDGLPVRDPCQQLEQRGSSGFGGVCVSVSRGGSVVRAEIFSQQAQVFQLLLKNPFVESKKSRAPVTQLWFCGGVFGFEGSSVQVRQFVLSFPTDGAIPAGHRAPLCSVWFLCRMW